MPDLPEPGGRRVRYSFNCFNHSTFLGLPSTLPEQIDAAALAGYDAIGFDVPSLLAHEADGLPPEALAERARDAGVPCFELVPLALAGEGSTAPHDLSTVSRLARAVGAEHILATVRGPVDDALVDRARLCAEQLGEAGVGVSLEFMGITPVATIDQAVTFLDRVDHPNLGLVLDSWHVCLGGTRWEDLDALPLERIGFVQFSDAASGASGTDRDDCMDRRLLPGEGVLPLVRFRDSVVAKGFVGVVSVEVVSEPWRSRPVAEFAAATLAATRAVWER